MVMSSSDSRTVKEAIDDLGDVVTEIYLLIPPTVWTDPPPYTCTFRDSRVLADSYIEVTVENSSVDATADYIEYYKLPGGGGLVFKPNKRPTADLELAITITNAQMHAASSINADTVVTDAISGASSVDGALTVLNSNINTMVGTHSTDIVALKNDLGIVESGDTATHTIAQGQYVIWHSALYTADAAITSGTTLAASGNDKNLTAVENGGLNAIRDNIKTGNFPTISTGTTASNGLYISELTTITFPEPFSSTPTVMTQTYGGNGARSYQYRINNVTAAGFSFWLIANSPDYGPPAGTWMAIRK